MCGIFGTSTPSSTTAATQTFSGICQLEYRGYDSWGVAALTQNSLFVQKGIGKPSDAVVQLPESKLAIGHTRWATHGGVTETNAHPHLDCSGQIAVVHNGIVENQAQLRKTLTDSGHTLVSQTDSELLAHVIESERNATNLLDAVKRMSEQIVGSQAVVMLDATTQTIIGCQLGLPLIVGKRGDQISIASDIQALSDCAEEVYPLQYGEVVEISGSTLTCSHVSDSNTFVPQFSPIPQQLTTADKGTFSHFMLKEIHEQPAVLQRIAKTPRSAYSHLLQLMKDTQIVFVGCGTAYHAGLFGQHFLREQGIQSDCIPAHEIASYRPLLRANTTLIAISQSGETADTIDAIQLAKSHGATTIGVINAPYSSMSRLVNHVVPVAAGPEVAVVSTKALLAQIATLFQLTSVSDDQHHHRSEQLSYAARSLNTWLPTARNTLEQLTHSLADHNDLFVLAKGSMIVAALETALKLKEAAYIYAEAFPAGELKHGILSLITTNTPCLILDDADNASSLRTAATEISARGGTVIALSASTFAESSRCISLPNLGTLQMLATLVAGQLLAYDLACANSLNPDTPRNLAKSVTVR